MVSAADVQAVEGMVGHAFADRGLLEQALRHASVADARIASNERLEFLGDAVLGLVACELIFRKYPALLEGEMTKIKSAVVSRTSCARVAKEIGLTAHLALGKGMKSASALPTSLAGATLEAVVGALFIDAGLEKVRVFLIPLLEPRVEEFARSAHQDNYKSVVQQHAQQRQNHTPVYQVLSQTGPDHDKTFEVCVRIGDRVYPPGVGSSKKQAEQAAAYNALRAMGLLPEGGSENAGAGLGAGGDAVNGGAHGGVNGEANGEVNGQVKGGGPAASDEGV